MKSPTDVLSVDAECEFYFADPDTALPATATAELDAGFGSAGFLEDPPDFAPDRPTSDITAWNADDPIRTLIESSELEVTIKLQQTSALAVELYWGLGDWASDGGDGAVWTPRSGEVVKAGVLHLTDGLRIFRHNFARLGISSVGNMNLTRAEAVSYEVTLKRLAAPEYTGPTQLYSWVPQGVEFES